MSGADGAAVTVVYRAAAAAGAQAHRRFALSFRQFEPGAPHRLVVVYEGFRDPQARAAATAALAGLGPQEAVERAAPVSVARACIAAARHAATPLVAFLDADADAEVRAAGWLGAFCAALERPWIGMVGAAGSHESARDSRILVEKAVWLARTARIPRDPRIAAHFRPWLQERAPEWLVTDGLADRGASAVPAAAEAAWAAECERLLRGPFAHLARAPGFPDPHLRPVAVAAACATLLAAAETLPGEAAPGGGWAGLCAAVRHTGRALAVAGRDGRLYREADWLRSRTFRADMQQNLLVADDAARAYADAPGPERDTLRLMTWGAAALPPGRGERLGLPFAGAPAPAAMLRAGAEDGPGLALVYLARAAEGQAAFRRFVQSYRRHPAGARHRLVVIYKGFDRPAEREAAAAAFEGLAAEALDMDDVHVDIGAYLEAARRSDARLMVFLNTHSEVLAPGWLRILRDAAGMPGVGLAGATASFESLRDSLHLLSKAIWMAGLKKVPFDARIAAHFRWELERHAPGWLRGGAGPAPSPRVRFGQWHRRALEAEWRRYWDALTAPGGPLAHLAEAAPFPNPHIRSNGFAIERARLLALFPEIAPGKEAAYRFEGGRDSLSARIRRSGDALVVADRQGRVHREAGWDASRTFRLGDQGGLLVADNQTRSFEALSPPERDQLVLMSWGAEALAPGAGCPLGMAFRRDRLTADDGATAATEHLCDNADYGAPNRRLRDASVFEARLRIEDCWLTGDPA